MNNDLFVWISWLVKPNSKPEEDVLSSSFLFVPSVQEYQEKGQIFLQSEKKVAKL
jgi:hypothetical protein